VQNLREPFSVGVSGDRHYTLCYQMCRDIPPSSAMGVTIVIIFFSMHVACLQHLNIKSLSTSSAPAILHCGSFRLNCALGHSDQNRINTPQVFIPSWR
jgi:hypothetical protein